MQVAASLMGSVRRKEPASSCDFSSTAVDAETRRQICNWLVPIHSSWMCIWVSHGCIVPRCVDTIHRHLCLMNSVCKGIITENKLQSATIGLLYLMRNGIVVHELVVLPKLQVSGNFIHS